MPTKSSNSSEKKEDQSKRIGGLRPSGIAELDEILGGGYPSDSTILLTGASGTGKTILSLQWLAAGYVQNDEPGLYLTLTEPVNKIKRNAERLDFWEKDFASVGKIYVEDLRTIMNSLKLGTKELTIKDIDKIIEAISELMMTCKARRVVIDSITAIAYRLEKRDLIRTFIYRLDAMLSQTDVNVILTSEVVEKSKYSVFGVEEFISDGIIQLSREKSQSDLVRKLQVIKMRGVEYDSHSTSYRISRRGLELFPRMEKGLTYQVSKNRVSTGIAGLDTMTGGGYFQGSSVLITGSSGTGKSLISLQFLVSALQEGKKALLVSFEESREQIYRNGEAFGWDLATYEEKEGTLRLINSYPEEKYLEEHISDVVDEVESLGAEVVVFDSLSALGNVFSKDVLRDFVSRLISYFKSKSVTVILTNATSTLLGADQITDGHLSTMTDHIIMLRYVEIQSELKHAALILKMRGSKHDKRLREISFTEQGIEITSEFSGYEGVLSGSTRRISKSIEDQLHELFIEILGPMGEKIFKEEKEKGITSDRMWKMLEELGDQGILSVRRKSEFTRRAEKILGEENTNKDEDDSVQNQEKKPHPIKKLFTRKA